ncbi:MAG TPA: phosphoglucosamine mutase [Tepidisphaeraceae bacterium]|jgi:phosphomannomutase|nr:phosphoglucosamine mutase [Tepidisphaeraceae bacterium]
MQTELMIGISGMRGTVGGSLTPAVVCRMAAAFAAFLKGRDRSKKQLRVVFGRDSRPSGIWVRDAAVAALVASGMEVVDLDIVSTPGVAMMVRHLDADAGIIATASHNPIEWNGLKFLNRDAVAPPPADAQAIADLYQANGAEYAEVHKLIPPRRDTQTHALHVKRVLDHVDVLGISSKRYRVVLDSVNGAGCVATATLLSKLGCQLIHLNATPDGRFPHEPEPTEKNLVSLSDEVRRHRAVVGFAQDPDADRLAIVDEAGTYIGEEYSLILCAKWLLSRRPGVAVANLSSSRMLDDVAAAHNSRVIRTPVGEANVVQAMLAHQAVVGGEGNGGVIDLRVVPGRDSLVGMAYVLQLMAGTGLSISQLVAQIPRYQIVKTKFPCRREDANRVVAALKSCYASEKIDVQDGIRVDWPDAWLHARPSNTEPIMRIIAEAPDRPTAEKIIGEAQSVAAATIQQPELQKASPHC